MNALSVLNDVLHSIARGLKAFNQFMCSAATYAPPFDLSGVETTSGVKQTFLDNSGKFFYYDENGKKVYVDPAKDTFVDFRKGRQYVPDFEVCLTDGADKITLGAIVRRDDDLAIKSIKYIILANTQEIIAPGLTPLSVINEYPTGWNETECPPKDCNCGSLTESEIDEETPIENTP